MITRLTTAPTVEPVTLTETKMHLRLATTEAAAAAYTAEDNLLTGLIAAARQYAENLTRRAFINQTWTGYLANWPAVLRLPYPPLSSVTSITVEGTAFTAFTASKDGTLKPGTNWPVISAAATSDPIVIVWVAGYGAAAANVPGPIKQAILLLIGHYYANREATVPGVSIITTPLAVDALLNPYRWIELI